MGFGKSNLNAIVQSQGYVYQIETPGLASLINRRFLLRMIYSKFVFHVYEDIATLAAMAFSQNVKHRLANWLVLSCAKSASEKNGINARAHFKILCWTRIGFYSRSNFKRQRLSLLVQGLNRDTRFTSVD